MHENFRFQPWYRRIRAIIDSGELGEIYQASYRLRPGDGQGRDAYLDRQPYFQDMERFLIHETAIHFVDVFRYLFGEPEAVMADLRRHNPAIAGEDAGYFLFRYERGLRVLFDGNRLVDHAAVNRRLTMGEMLLEAEKACLRLVGDGHLWLRRHGSNEEEAVDFAFEDRGFGGDCVHALQRHVVDHLAGMGPLVNSAADYIRNLAIERAIYQSDDEGRWIGLEQAA